MQINKNKSYSLVEIIVIIAVIIAAAVFVIPNYSIARERANERNANLNLIAIHSAALMYQSKHSKFPESGDLEHINNTLNLKIEDKNFTYYFDSNNYSYSTTAHRLGNLYILTVTEDNLSNNNPICSDGTKKCPSKF